MPTDELKNIQSGLAGKVSPQINANDLVEPPTTAKFTPPTQPNVPTRTQGTVKNVATDLTSFITAQSEEAKQLEARRQEYAALGADSTLSEMYNQKASEFGATSESLKELKDIQLQLADANTNSEVTKTKIAGAAGQTMGQAQREVTQEDRENAVRNAGLAARAAVLQGNIETGRALAKDAVDIAYQDRQLRNQNLLNQINDLSGTVDKQTQQLLDKEKRVYEEDQQRLEDLKQNIAEAVASGSASQSEIQQLNDPRMDDESKTALAQSIVGRSASTERDLKLEGMRAENAASWALTRQREADTNLKLAESGDPVAIARLGYDPNDVKGGVEGAREYEVQKTDIQAGITAAQSLLSNMEGLNLSSGAYQSPFLTTLAKNVVGTTAGFTAAGSIVPGIGTVTGGLTGLGVSAVTAPSAYSYYKTSKDQFLSDASFLINDGTFKEIVELKASGVTFGQMTEGERIAAGRAATQLAAAAIIDESGQVTGFRGDSKKITQYINEIQIAYEGRQEYLDKQYAIKPDEETEADNIWKE
jgi:hypothetical protein